MRYNPEARKPIPLVTFESRFLSMLCQIALGLNTRETTSQYFDTIWDEFINTEARALVEVVEVGKEKVGRGLGQLLNYQLVQISHFLS